MKILYVALLYCGFSVKKITLRFAEKAVIGYILLINQVKADVKIIHFVIQTEDFFS